MSLIQHSDAMYSSETWPFGKTGEIRFNIFKRKILKKIFGSRKDDRTED
jgi:hypothetical protein